MPPYSVCVVLAVKPTQPAPASLPSILPTELYSQRANPIIHIRIFSYAFLKIILFLYFSKCVPTSFFLPSFFPPSLSFETCSQTCYIDKDDMELLIFGFHRLSDAYAFLVVQSTVLPGLFGWESNIEPCVYYMSVLPTFLVQST